MLLSHRRALDSKFELWKWDRRRSFQSPLQNWHSKSGAEKTRACAPLLPGAGTRWTMPRTAAPISSLFPPLSLSHTRSHSVSLASPHIAAAVDVGAGAGVGVGIAAGVAKKARRRAHTRIHTRTHIGARQGYWLGIRVAMVTTVTVTAALKLFENRKTEKAKN